MKHFMGGVFGALLTQQIYPAYDGTFHPFSFVVTLIVCIMISLVMTVIEKAKE